MTEPAVLLARYLRQRGELGETELFLPLERVRALARRAAPPAGPRRQASEPVDERAAAPPPPRRPESPRRERAGAAAPEAPGTRYLLSGSDGSGEILARGFGAADAPIAVVADVSSPGEWPFSGAAGALLDRLLLAVGIPGEAVLRCTVEARDQESEASSPPAGAVRVAPKLYLGCGPVALQAFLGTAEPVAQLRGRPLAFGGTPVIATYGLEALVRQPAWLRPAWADFQRLRAALDE